LQNVPMKKRLLCCLVVVMVLAGVTPITTSYYFEAIASPAPEINTDSHMVPHSTAKDAVPPVSNGVQVQPVRKTRNNIPILMYHQIGDGPNSLYVRDQEFNEQMKYLYDNQYNVVTLAQAAEMLKNRSIPEKTVSLTFDDGYQTFYDKVWPLLKQYNFNATVFVITYNLNNAPFLNWEEVKTLAQNGVEIGCHTRTHPSLKNMASDEMDTEILSSRQDIEAAIGMPVKTFCYPSGEYRQMAVNMVGQNGYVAAVTTRYGVAGYNNDRYLLPRVRISRGLTLQEFVGRVE